MAAPPDHTAHLLVRLVADAVRECIDFPRLDDLEQRIAEHVAALPDVDDAHMLAVARGLISRALRGIADAIEHPGFPTGSCRYLNAICRESEDLSRELAQPPP